MNNCEIEEWRPIVGFKHYEVSNFGNVRSISHWRKSKGNGIAWHQGKILKSQKSIHGYLRIGLQCGNGTMRTMSVHRLVAEAKRLGFTPGKDLYHKDNNKIRHDGCCWKYLDDKNFTFPQYKSWKKPIVGKSIIDDSVITFESIREANRNGYMRESIKRAIRNGNAYRNYLWSLM